MITPYRRHTRLVALLLSSFALAPLCACEDDPAEQMKIIDENDKIRSARKAHQAHMSKVLNQRAQHVRAALARREEASAAQQDQGDDARLLALLRGALARVQVAGFNAGDAALLKAASDTRTLWLSDADEAAQLKLPALLSPHVTTVDLRPAKAARRALTRWPAREAPLQLRALSDQPDHLTKTVCAYAAGRLLRVSREPDGALYPLPCPAAEAP